MSYPVCSVYNLCVEELRVGKTLADSLYLSYARTWSETKMATSTKASFNFHQNGKYATLPQAGKDMEITQDMHLKMSKKIAQLTKVSNFRTPIHWFYYYKLSYSKLVWRIWQGDSCRVPLFCLESRRLGSVIIIEWHWQCVTDSSTDNSNYLE